MTRVSSTDDIFFTKTMAEILEKQGMFEDALTIYRLLLETSNEPEEIKARVERLKALAHRRRRPGVG
ncbi:MAG: hypothetical protein HY887_08290 [Deltaproteobacteria bacterium]|nr:hypothetical protein [Deltaproteobacteria bacterium]